jgi:hypothetical protein
MKGIYHVDAEEMKIEINCYRVLQEKNNFATVEVWPSLLVTRHVISSLAGGIIAESNAVI